MDTPVESLHLLTLRDLIEKDSWLLPKWVSYLPDFVREKPDVLRLSEEWRIDRSYRGVILKTLEIWVKEHKGSTLACLVEKFRKHRFANLARTVEEKIKEDRAYFIKPPTLNTIPFKSKWWPVNPTDTLDKTLYKRKDGEQFIVEKIRNLLEGERKAEADSSSLASQRRTWRTVVLQGFPGVGKTTTTKWYCQEYEDCYDCIVWINCGEGRLERSFRNLNRYLKLLEGGGGGGGGDYELSEQARDAFDGLAEFKCLFVFDNVESSGEIRNLLPKQQENFHSIITTGHTSWGKIPTLEIKEFSPEESLAFMKNIILVAQEEEEEEEGEGGAEPKKFADEDLKILGELLGHLPLALRIAISALTQGNGNDGLRLSEYIALIEQQYHILHEEPPGDYAKSIKCTLQISLDLIGKSSGDPKSANQILTTFAYIQPDSVELNFFTCVEKILPTAIHSTMILLAKYSLISIKRSTPPPRAGNRIIRADPLDFQFEYSIHRLLQQVIRFKETCEKNTTTTLRKILECDKHVKYKVFPLAYAPKELKVEFQCIVRRLMQDKELERLMLKEKFLDASELAKLFHESEQGSAASKYNYAICLQKRRKLEEACNLWKELYEEVDKELSMGQLVRANPETELIKYGDVPGKGIVGSQLLIHYLRQERAGLAHNILQEEKLIWITNSEEYLGYVCEFLDNTPLYYIPHFVLVISKWIRVTIAEPEFEDIIDTDLINTDRHIFLRCVVLVGAQKDDFPLPVRTQRITSLRPHDSSAISDVPNNVTYISFDTVTNLYIEPHKKTLDIFNPNWAELQVISTHSWEFIKQFQNVCGLTDFKLANYKVQQQYSRSMYDRVKPRRVKWGNSFSLQSDLFSSGIASSEVFRIGGGGERTHVNYSTCIMYGKCDNTKTTLLNLLIDGGAMDFTGNVGAQVSSTRQRSPNFFGMLQILKCDKAHLSNHNVLDHSIVYSMVYTRTDYQLPLDELTFANSSLETRKGSTTSEVQAPTQSESGTQLQPPASTFQFKAPVPREELGESPESEPNIASFSSSPVANECPNLDILHIELTPGIDVDLSPHYELLQTTQYVSISTIERDWTRVQLNSLPSNIRHLKLTRIHIVGEGQLPIERLVLQEYDSISTHDILRRVRPKFLLLSKPTGFDENEFEQLIRPPVKSVIVCFHNWNLPWLGDIEEGLCYEIVGGNKRFINKNTCKGGSERLLRTIREFYFPRW